MPPLPLLPLPLLALLVVATQARDVRDTLDTADGFTFVVKFCYQVTDTAEEQENARMDISWAVPSALWASAAGVDCWAKVDAAKQAGGATPITASGGVAHYHLLDHVRHRFWYLAVANCNETRLKVKFDVQCTNADGTEFSCEEKGLLPTYAVFLALYIVLLCTALVSDFLFWLKQSLQSLSLLLTVLLVLLTLACMLSTIHWATYGNNGIGCKGCYIAGLLVDSTVEVAFMLVLLVAAQGVFITGGFKHARLLAVVISGVSLVYVVLYITAVATYDKESSRAFFASPVGVLMLVTRLSALVLFAASLVLTYRRETTPFKRHFYIAFGSFYSVWFLLLPAVAFGCSFVHETTRLKTVTALHLVATFVGFVGWLLLVWPRWGHKFFHKYLAPAEQARLLEEQALCDSNADM
eukprot:TRINITY_DN11276_c0_g1_i1.p1 TRINITY_DN11276_c0_g1~~TRINITY_DN11276_c0_g1_i1.p1  ORF type:complete len:410 (-),score=107.85 TRINITY_DN11276_c0_g1_i1:39-1268(-)